MSDVSRGTLEPAPVPGTDDGTLKSKVDRLGLFIANEILAGKVVDKQNLDAFKVLSHYVVSSRKGGAQDDDPPPNGGTFEQWRDGIASAANRRT